MKGAGWRTHKSVDKKIHDYTIRHNLRVAKYKARRERI